MPLFASKDYDKLLPVRAEDAWESFTRARQVEQAVIRPEIISSWKRCLSLGVDPYGKSPATDLIGEEGLECNRVMLSAAETNLRRMFELLEGRGYIVMLLSRDGYILRLFGDRKVVSLAESLNVFQGANNSEQSIGTFAPGICIAEKKAVQVHWCEHFRQVYHDWCCTAAPLLNSQRELMGVIDITSVDRAEHSPALLNLAQLTAAAVEAETNYQMARTDYSKIYSYFSTVADTAAEPMVVFDQYDRLTHLNSKAKSLLGPGGQMLVGREASSFISNYASVKQGMKAGRHLTELHFLGPADHISIDANLKEMRSETSESLGIIGVLQKKTSSRKLESAARFGFQDFIHHSRSMADLVGEAKEIAVTNHTVLILGESGTGKEVLAQAIHRFSQKRDEPFIAVNCAALPKELIQSELFGYEGGAFTGAVKGGKPGKFEQADGGTIFLDEIGDMPLEAQASLLRVLQEKSVTRVGGV